MGQACHCRGQAATKASIRDSKNRLIQTRPSENICGGFEKNVQLAHPIQTELNASEIKLELHDVICLHDKKRHMREWYDDGMSFRKQPSVILSTVGATKDAASACKSQSNIDITAMKLNHKHVF